MSVAFRQGKYLSREFYSLAVEPAGWLSFLTWSTGELCSVD
jgi:hypothetical protein